MKSVPHTPHIGSITSNIKGIAFRRRNHSAAPLSPPTAWHPSLTVGDDEEPSFDWSDRSAESRTPVEIPSKTVASSSPDPN
jgi:hypothetical protein